MDLGLKDKVVLVTGASKGIGRGIALAFAGEGARVGICARGETDLKKVAGEVAAQGAEVFFLTCDVTDRGQVERVMAAVVERFGGLDVLVNNAGGAGRFATFMDLTDEDWRQAWDFNVMSIVWFTRLAVPVMQKAGGGRIINLSSTAGKQPGANTPHYAAAKAGATTPLRAQAEALYALFNGLGYGGKDFSAMVQMLRGRIDTLA